MSFSLSRLRSTLRSMSIAGRSKLGLWMPELHLNGTGAQRGVTEAAAVARHVQGYPVGIGGENPAGDGSGIGGGHLDQASTARRQCLGSVSGRSTPGEETSSV